MSAFLWGRSLTDVSSAFPSASGVELPTDSQPVSSSCGYAHNLVLTEDGSVWSQGSKQQIGRRGNASVFGRVAGLGDEPIVAIAAGALHSCAVSLTGELWEFGLLFERFDVGGGAGGGGSGGGHELAGMSTRLNRNEYLRRIVMRSEAAYLANRNIAEVSAEAVASGRGGAGSSSSAGAGSGPAKADDDVNAADILRIKVRRVLLDRPRLASGLEGVKIRAVACGYAHTLALDSDGQLWASGYNDKGSLGTGDRLASAKFKRVVLPPGTVIAKIACGQQHNLAASVDGRCFAWGSGVLGQLGTGGSGDRLAPKLITPLVEGGHHIVDVACGSNHSVVLDAEGAVLAFGHSEYGQMGADGGGVGDLRYAARHYYVPRPVEGLARHRATAIAAGGQFSLALLWDGSVVSWGWNSYHCLGRGDGERYLQHYGRVAGLAGNRVRQISCGYHHAACTTAPSGSAFAAGWLAVLRAVPENRDVPVYTRKRALAVPAGTANGPKGLTPEEAFELGAGREIGGSDDDGLGPSAASSDMYGMFSAAGAGARSRGRGRGAGAGGGGGAAAAAARFRVKGGNVAPGTGAGAAGAGAGAGGDGGVGGSAAAALEPTPEAEGYVSWATAGDGPCDAAAGCMPGESLGEEGVGEDWCMPADVLLIPVDDAPGSSVAAEATPAAASPAVDGSTPDAASARGLAFSADMEAKRKALQLALLKVLGRGGSGTEGIVDAAGGEGVAAALARGALPSGGPIGVHAVMLAHRLPALAAALEASRAKAATVTLTAGRGCPLITVSHIAAEGRWEVQFTGVRRVVLAALAAFLYADVLVAVPAHRLQKLKQLAEGLRLTRLSALCDEQAHAYDRAADFHAEVDGVRSRHHARHRAASASSASSGEPEAAEAAADCLTASDLHAGVPLDSTFIPDMRAACGPTGRGVDGAVAGSGAGAAPLAGCRAPAHADLLVHVQASEFSAGDATPDACGGATASAAASALMFPVHRLILCRSEYFRKLIQGDFAEARLGAAAAPTACAAGTSVSSADGAGVFASAGGGLPTLRLEDVEPHAFASLIDYLYTGDLQPCMEDPERCMATLALAARFCMGDLATRLQDILAERVEAADAPLLLEFADTHSLPRLAKIARAMAAMESTRDGGAGVAATASASASTSGGRDGGEGRRMSSGLIRTAA